MHGRVAVDVDVDFDFSGVVTGVGWHGLLTEWVVRGQGRGGGAVRLTILGWRCRKRHLHHLCAQPAVRIRLKGNHLLQAFCYAPKVLVEVMDQLRPNNRLLFQAALTLLCVVTK